ncbi:MAG: hypothetical protein WCO35_02080 [Candidatus Nomurabacteria bacterium]
MVNGQLIDYIKKQSSQGVPQEQIIDYLLSVGWREKEINEALWEANSDVPVPSHLLKKDGPNVLFMSVRSFILVIVILLVLWEAINIYDYKVNPNPRIGNYYSISLKIYKTAVDYWHYENNTACPLNQNFADASFPNCSCPLDLSKDPAYIVQNKKTVLSAGQYSCIDISLHAKNIKSSNSSVGTTTNNVIEKTTTTIINQ